MSFVVLLFLAVAVQVSPLSLIEEPPVESQEGLSCSFNISGPRCSDEGWVEARQKTPGLPKLKVEVSSRADEREQIVPVLFLTITQPIDASMNSLKGMEVQVLEVNTNSSLCVRYIFKNKLQSITKPDDKAWSFTLDRVVVNPGLKYQVSVFNLPKPDVGRRAVVKEVITPGCKDPNFQKLNTSLETCRSLWEPNLIWSLSDSEDSGGVIKITFNTGRVSDLYRVAIYNPDFHSHLTVSKDNRTSINVNFSLNAWQLKRCKFYLEIEPCANNSLTYKQEVNYCSYRKNMVWAVFVLAGLIFCVFYAVLLHCKTNNDVPSSSQNTNHKDEVVSVPVQSSSQVLIIYSLDHPLYKEIVLKLCAFLRAKCGTEVTLDLLDFTWLSAVGRIQWLDMQRERLSSSSDKVLILCSRGVYAKWRGMCGGSRVMTREDVHSPLGDMLTPALSLIIPDFIHALSFQKYIVAYFGDISSEKDVPAPFNVAVKYELMKHFEELFFRLVDKEKHKPGSVKLVEGLGEEDYFNCVSGKALKNAIEAFQTYQQANPNWFEMELVNTDEDTEQSGLEIEGDPQMSVLQNELWALKPADPALINEIKDQMHEAQPLTTETDFYLNETYSTMLLGHTLKGELSASKMLE